MSADVTGELIASYLAAAQEAALRRDWDEVLELAGDVLVLDQHHRDAQLLQTLAERHVGRGHPSWGRRQETVLFADLVASTALANRVDPELLRRQIRRYEQACLPVIGALGGHVHRFVGDGILASFGYPTAHEDDARRAVQAGLDLIDAVTTASADADLAAEQLEVRVGIASGVLVHADRGSAGWTQAGDLFGPAVNLAARIHEVAEPGQVCVSDETAILVAGHFELEHLGHHRLKGYDDAVVVHRARRRSAASSVRPPRATTPFTGRRPEMALLEAAWRRVCGDDGSSDDRSVAICVSGDPGVGKSRLVWELADTAAVGSVLDAQCSPYRSESPLHPVRAAMERRCDFDPGDDDDARVGKLAALLASTGGDDAALPYLALLLDLGDGPDSRVRRPEESPIQLRESTLCHLTQWLVGIATRAPTMLVVEDVHWADPSTRELLRRLIGARPAGLLTIVTSRTHPPWLDASLVERLAVMPLSDDETRSLAAAAAAELVPRLIDQIAQRSDGIPLFVEQLAASLAAADEMASAIPMRLAELLQSRLDSTGPSKRIAQLAATIGREFEPQLVEQMVQRLQAEGRLEQFERPLAELFDRLVDSNLVEADPIDDRRLRFHHALVGEAAYESMLLVERPDRHSVLADLLLERSASEDPVDPSVVAHHLTLAGRPVDAIQQYLAAAARGHAVGAFAEVAADLDRAEVLLASVPDEVAPALELVIRMSRGLAISSMGGYSADGAVADFARSVELCELIGESVFASPALVRAQLGLWSYYFVTADFESAGALSRSMERHLERVSTPAGRPSLHACRGVEQFFGGDLPAAQRELEVSVDLLTDDPIDAEWPLPNDPLAAALAFLGPVRYLRGDERGAREAIARGIEHSERLPFPLGPFSVAFVRNYETWMHRLRGDPDAAVTSAEEVVRLGDQHGFFDWQMFGRINVAAARIACEPARATLDELTDVMLAWRAAGGRLVASLLVEQGWGYYAIGDAGRAKECLDEADAFAVVGQALCCAEIHRLRAAMAVADSTVDVETELLTGLRRALEQDAALFAVRCATAHEERFGADALDLALRGPVEDVRRRFVTAAR